MTEPRNDDRAQARREAATLLGVDIEHLTAADSLRVDMVSALRLVIDSEQASILSGGSADLGKLNVAVQSLIALLPNRELPESAASRADPRAHMWAVYSEMRRRGELAEPTSTYEGMKAEVERLRGEIAALKAGVPAPDHATLDTSRARDFTAAPAPGDNVVKLSLRDDNSGRAAAPTPQPPKPAEDLIDLRAGYNNEPEPWRDFCGSGPGYDRWSDRRD
jgi:hypothetical protein